MFVHTVFFWLRPGLSPAERSEFDAGVASLCEIPGVRHAWRGSPAATNRPVIDRSYSVGLTLVFDDPASQDAYQAHPVHVRFVEQQAAKWARVQVYDFEA